MKYSPPRFYRVRVIASKSEMASYVAMIHDIDRERHLVGCDLYCIFSNYDDSGIGSGEDPSSSFKEKLRIEGRATTQFNARRIEEPQQVTTLFEQAYEDEPEITINRIRP